MAQYFRVVRAAGKAYQGTGKNRRVVGSYSKRVMQEWIQTHTEALRVLRSLDPEMQPLLTIEKYGA